PSFRPYSVSTMDVLGVLLVGVVGAVLGVVVGAIVAVRRGAAHRSAPGYGTEAQPEPPDPDRAVMDALRVAVVVLDVDDRATAVNTMAGRLGLVADGRLTAPDLVALVAQARLRGTPADAEAEVPRADVVRTLGSVPVHVRAT